MRKSIAEIAGYDRHDPAVVAATADAEKYAHLLDRLVAFRKRRGLSQASVADAMGTKQSAVSEMERSGANPRVRTLLRYARALGVDLQFQASEQKLSRPYTIDSTLQSVPTMADLPSLSAANRRVGKIAC